MDKGVWPASVHGITKESDMTEQLSLTYIWENQFSTARSGIAGSYGDSKLISFEELPC